MSGQIVFFKKNKADPDYASVVATASEAPLYAPYVLNRNNISGWMTTGSADANNTTFTVDLVDQRKLTDIILVKHNFKNFQIKYWDGSAYQDFSPAIHPTASTESVSRFSFTSVQTSKVQITIFGTQIANADKFLYQLILTETLGQLNGWPVIENPIFDLNLRNSRMLSGKTLIGENLGAFSCDLKVEIWRDSSDLSLIELLYESSEGFLVWLCGGNQSQFSSARRGYRLEDLFLMKCINPYTPQWYQGIYSSGMTLSISLAEVTR